MHCLSTVIKKCVGPAGLVGSSSTSENANVGCVTGFAFARPANRWGLAGPDGCGRTRNVGTRELLSWIVASVRVGSLSPSGPVLTSKVTKGAVTPGGGGLTMRGRKCRSGWRVCPPRPVSRTDRHAVKSHDLQRPRYAVIEQPHIIEAVG